MSKVKVLKHYSDNFKTDSSVIEKEIEDFVLDKKVLQMSQSLNPFCVYTTIIYETAN